MTNGLGLKREIDQISRDKGIDAQETVFPHPARPEDVSLTPKVQAIIEMIVEQGAAVEAVEHGSVEVHCHPNEWVLQVYQRTAKAFRKV